MERSDISFQNRSTNRRYNALMLRVTARILWTLPTTAIGLFVGGACLPFGARWQYVDGVLECHGGAVAWLLEHATILKGGALAITFGDVVLGRNPDALAVTRAHERVHVRQAHRWGPFFIPAYLAASVIAWFKTREGYYQNAFEVEARALSGPRR